MIKINRNEFFNILQNITLKCSYLQIKDKFFNEIEKFNNTLDFIDTNKYSFDYIQNRFIAVKNREMDIKNIRRIIVCPFDTKNINISKCENIKYEYSIKKRNSYLTKPINEEDRKKETDTNERDCIKGSMNPSLLNAIIIYMLNHDLIKKDNLIIFSLKSNDRQWHYEDITEYLKNNIYKFDNKLELFLEMRFCSEIKGEPNKDFTGKIRMNTNFDERDIDYIKSITRLNNENFKEELNYKLDLIRKPFVSICTEASRYFKVNKFFEARLFIFTDTPPADKFSTFFFDKEILVQWSSIENYINILYEILSI